MTESVLPLAWLDELLNSPAVDFSQLNPFVDEKENASALAVDTSPIQHFGRFAGHSFSSQLEGLMPALSKSELELETAALAKPPAGTSRTKQRLKQSKARRLSGVRTDAARRMEIAELKLEVPKLEARVDYLMQRAVSRSGHIPTLDKSRLVNKRLREVAQLQRLWVARGISAITQSLPQCSQPLLNHFIHLPRDAPSRVKTLCDLSAGILRDGREILHERMRFLNSDLLPRHEVSSHSTAEGDVCASVFGMIPVEGAATVKDVVDMLRQVLTLDRAFTCQKTGACSVTDAIDAHPDLEHHGIAHRRCVRLTSNGRVIEFKGVLFSEYEAPSHGSRSFAADQDCSEQATIVVHSVEDDQLHPYTSGRMRLDMTTIISIHHYRRHSQRYRLGSGYHNKDNKDTVVIARSSFVKLRRGDVQISTSEMRAEMDYMLSKGPEAIESALELLTLRENSVHEGSRSSNTNEFSSDFAPLQDIDTWPSGDWEVSTA